MLVLGDLVISLLNCSLFLLEWKPYLWACKARTSLLLLHSFSRHVLSAPLSRAGPRPTAAWVKGDMTVAPRPQRSAAARLGEFEFGVWSKRPFTGETSGVGNRLLQSRHRLSSKFEAYLLELRFLNLF